MTTTANAPAEQHPGPGPRHSPPGSPSPPAAQAPARDVAPRPAPGLELIGPYQGSGLSRPRFLVRRGDGQIAQLPELLYRLLEGLDGQRGPGALAGRLRDDHAQRAPSPEQVTTLLEDRLRPAGLLAEPPTSYDPAAETGHEHTEHDHTAAAPARPAPEARQASPAPRRPDPLLSLRYRRGVVPETAVWAIAGLGRWLFLPPVIAVGLAGFAAAEVALLAAVGFGGLLAAGQSLAGDPAGMLAVLGIIVVAGGCHEAGHVAACRYSGAVPGRMGVGLYLVWPAFYSDVTDAYRLDRRGRLRTDLGGVYVNAIVITALTGGYLATGQGWLLAAVALLHAETAYQFLPSLRLDGHYILADLVGVPDLFSRLGPILSSLGRRRPDHPLVKDLRPGARRVITAWVFLVIPFLAYTAVIFVVLAPQLAPTSWAALSGLGGDTAAALHAAQPARAVLDLVQLPLLVLPWLGGALIVATLARRLTRLARTRMTKLGMSPSPSARQHPS